ncbi:Retrovirus-related Pol polyprotein from transposon RE2 [Linum perenne]
MCPSPRTIQPPPQAHYSTSPSQPHPPNPTWTLDFGATHHLTNDLANLALHSEYRGTEQVQLSDGKLVPISHSGSARSLFHGSYVDLDNILVVPAACQDLLSISALTRDNDLAILFFDKWVFIQDLSSRRILYQGRSRDRLYSIPFSLLDRRQPRANSVSLTTWHRRMGHANMDSVKRVLRDCSISFSNKRVTHLCSDCCAGKMHKQPFPLSNYRVENNTRFIVHQLVIQVDFVFDT